MQISVTVIDGPNNANITSDFVTLDVSPDFTFGELKALIETETNAPKASQLLSRDGQPITNDTKTLSEVGVTEGDLIALSIQPTRTTQQPQNRSGQPSPEQFRQHILSNAAVMNSVRQQDPELAAAAQDSTRFQNLFAARQRRLEEDRRQAEREMARLDNDFWNPDSQAEIEKRIKQQQIAKNIELAMEENPESFARVSMLYIDVVVNNVPIKAFVDSGAQTTIMSPDAARRCNITHLIDERYGGIARGVGTAKILGRVHHATMQLGVYQAASSFTVMEGKDVDLLLGLDMLKRHQMCIDLRENCLRVQDAKIEFLPEHQIPNMMDEALDNEPKVEGPGGTTIGAETGTVAPPPKPQESSQPAAASDSSSQPAQSSNTPAPAPQQPQQPSQQTTSAQGGSFGFGQTQAITEESIAAVMQFGVDREMAVNLLQQAGGNPDLAISLML